MQGSYFWRVARGEVNENLRNAVFVRVQKNGLMIFFKFLLVHNTNVLIDYYNS